MPGGDATTDELVSAFRSGVLRLARRLRFEQGSDLTLTQLMALGAIARSDDGLTIGELAANEHVKPPSMTRTVNSLEALGLVTRGAVEGDGRRVLVRLTAAGDTTVQTARQRRDSWLASRLHQLSADERQLLHDVVPLIEQIIRL